MPSDEDTIQNGSRREQRVRKRRSWKRRLLIGVAGTLIVSGAAFALTSPFRSGSDSAASRSDVGHPAPTAAAVEQHCRTPLNPLDPLRLWIGGDSLAGSLGPSLGELAGKSGVVQPVFDSRVSSGLLSPDFVDWPKHGVEDMTIYNPEVAVFIIGANDAKNLPKSAEQDPAWRAQYTALVEQMLAALQGNGRTVYWIGAPVMADTAYSEHVKGVNSIFQEVAAKHPGVVYIDAYSLFSTPNGAFSPMLTVPDGKVARVRADDGVHFTPDGGDLLAKTVFDQLNPQCKITEQAVQGVVKTTIEAAGSSSVPGTRRSGGPTGTTTKPAGTTAPPTPQSTQPAPEPPPTAPASSAAPPTTGG
jgi:hypothetical protein